MRCLAADAGHDTSVTIAVGNSEKNDEDDIPEWVSVLRQESEWSALHEAWNLSLELGYSLLDVGIPDSFLTIPADDEEEEDNDQFSWDEYCSVCQDGGNVMCCENCPKVAHYGCIGLKSAPKGDWWCKDGIGSNQIILFQIYCVLPITFHPY